MFSALSGKETSDAANVSNTLKQKVYLISSHVLLVRFSLFECSSTSTRGIATLVISFLRRRFFIFLNHDFRVVYPSHPPYIHFTLNKGLCWWKQTICLSEWVNVTPQKKHLKRSIFWRLWTVTITPWEILSFDYYFFDSLRVLVFANLLTCYILKFRNILCQNHLMTTWIS